MQKSLNILIEKKTPPPPTLNNKLFFIIEYKEYLDLVIQETIEVFVSLFDCFNSFFDTLIEIVGENQKEIMKK